MNNFFKYTWRIVRYLKPVRTFWMTLASLLPVLSTGIGSGSAGITNVDWVTALSGSATAAIFNFVVLMSTGDSLWSEPKNAIAVSEAKPIKYEPKHLGDGTDGN